MVRGNPQDDHHWVHGVQPAWSLDMLWIPCRDIMLRRVFAANELPLFRLQPTNSEHTALFAEGDLPWKRNANVYQGQLRCGGDPFGWGFGVHGQHRLAFALPDSARSFRCNVGLDSMVGEGGCIQARVLASGDFDEQTLFESEFLVGSGDYVDTGDLALPSSEKPRKPDS